MPLLAMEFRMGWPLLLQLAVLATLVLATLVLATLVMATLVLAALVLATWVVEAWQIVECLVKQLVDILAAELGRQ